MTLAQRLARRYEELSKAQFPGGAENAIIIRTYAGRHQKAAGAVTFYLSPRDRPGLAIVGSAWPASACVRQKVELYTPPFRSGLIPEFMPE